MNWNKKLFIYRMLPLVMAMSVQLFCSCDDDNPYAISNDDATIQTRAITAQAGKKLEEVEEILLSGGDTVRAPWANNATTNAIDDIRCDVKESDGWKVLFTTCKLLGHSSKVDRADKDVNYLLLYNRNTGVLKGFVYLSKGPGKNNNAYFYLECKNNTKLFNFTPYFALAGDSQESPKKILVSIASKSPNTKGFQKGWNCFVTELAYDENSMNNELYICGYNYNTKSINFYGLYEFESKGEIVSSKDTGKDPFGIASAAGREAGDWIKEKADSTGNATLKTIANILKGGISSGVSSLVSSGLSALFGSIRGTSYNKYDLQFTTNGKVTIKGESVMESNSVIPPISGIKLNKLGENLGVWNLEKTPTFAYNNSPKLKQVWNTGGNLINIYRMEITPEYTVKVNPALKCSRSVKMLPIIYDANGWGNDKGWNNLNSGYYVNVTRTVALKQLGFGITQAPLSYDVYAYDMYPTKTSINNVPAADLKNGRYGVKERLAMQVACTFNIDGKSVYSVKTFVPNIIIKTDGSARPHNWQLRELENKGYVKTQYYPN